mmetsp:Transcript_17618/g.42333  ORF Transcript_17618/g.42333 Transcript_17618/m.42333 type:complete len:242 (-) Transcript_17618:1189-1914(-)
MLVAISPMMVCRMLLTVSDNGCFRFLAMASLSIASRFSHSLLVSDTAMGTLVQSQCPNWPIPPAPNSGKLGYTSFPRPPHRSNKAWPAAPRAYCCSSCCRSSCVTKLEGNREALPDGRNIRLVSPFSVGLPMLSLALSGGHTMSVGWGSVADAAAAAAAGAVPLGCGSGAGGGTGTGGHETCGMAGRWRPSRILSRSCTSSSYAHKGSNTSLAVCSSLFMAEADAADEAAIAWSPLWIFPQ